MSHRIDEELRRELEAVAQSVGCVLDDVEFKGSLLRLVIDRPEGAVTVDDCATVSRQASALLDVVDFGTARYVLEVSSPGLDRPLRRADDYRRFLGRLAKVTYESEGAVKRTVTGRLEAFDPAAGGTVTLVTQQDEQLQVPLARIARARLEIEI